MVTVTLVPPVITPGAKAGRFFVFVNQTVSLRSFEATLSLDGLAPPQTNSLLYSTCLVRV